MDLIVMDRGKAAFIAWWHAWGLEVIHRARVSWKALLHKVNQTLHLAVRSADLNYAYLGTSQALGGLPNQKAPSGGSLASIFFTFAFWHIRALKVADTRQEENSCTDIKLLYQTTWNGCYTLNTLLFRLYLYIKTTCNICVTCFVFIVLVSLSKSLHLLPTLLSLLRVFLKYTV